MDYSFGYYDAIYAYEEQREARRLRQEACDHPQEKHYPLTATDHILCLDCGKQFPVEGDE